MLTKTEAGIAAVSDVVERRISPLGFMACPACASDYVAYVQEVLGRRSGKRFPQYACLDCRTYFHRSGYREDDTQQRSDFDYLVKQRDNHRAISGQLCLELITRLPHIHSVLEIGYGMGWFMDACRNYKIPRIKGFEVNPYAHEHATKTLGLDCTLGLFDETHHDRYDLIAAIMVFEHLENPRELFRDMVGALNSDGAIYLSVPFFERRDWPFLRTAGTKPGDLPDLMHDNDVHINHFSVDGLERLGLSLGARTAEAFVSKDTFWKSPGAFPGMLFRF